MAGLLKRIERRGRRLLASGLGRVMRPRSAGLPSAPSSIVVTRPDSRLGNLVLLEPLLSGLHERFPEARLTVIASDRFSRVLEGREWDLVAAPKAAMARNPAAFALFVRRVRRIGFDVAIDASHPGSFSLSGAAMTALSGAPARVGFRSDGHEAWYSVAIDASDGGVHESAALHSLGSCWHGWPAWRPPLLKSDASRTGAIGLHVGASRGKFYPPGKLARLCLLLSAKAPVEIYWGSGSERALAERIVCRGARVMPATDIPGLVRSLAGLGAFVTADNGPMHVASALGTPVLALFRIDNWARFGPLSTGSRVLYDPAGVDPEVASEAMDVILEARGAGQPSSSSSSSSASSSSSS
jgi:ADP-heptose:LPS heptosyltransferase